MQVFSAQTSDDCYTRQRLITPWIDNNLVGQLIPDENEITRCHGLTTGHDTQYHGLENVNFLSLEVKREPE